MRGQKQTLCVAFPLLLAAAILLLTAAPASASYKLVDQWGSPGTGIATDSKDRVYVADPDRELIRQFDSSGNLLTRFSGGASDPYFGYGASAGLATDSKDNVYAPSHIGGGPYDIFLGIRKFDSDGTFLTEFPTEWKVPKGVAIDSKDNVYVAGPELPCCGGPRRAGGGGGVSKYDSSGNFLTYWETSASGYGAPNAIAIDSKYRVYVADSEAGQIQKFDSSGNLLSVWDMSAAGAIATDSEDNVYMVSVLAILKYDSSGNGITHWRSPGGIPSGLATDSEDNVYALDPSHERVWKFADDTVLAGSASAKAAQIKKGGDIRVRVRVAAQEALTAEASGRIKGNPSYKLKPKSMSLAEGESRTLQLTPNKRKQAKKIAKALKKGKKAKAKLTVKLTDEAGNKKSEKLSVKLKR